MSSRCPDVRAPRCRRLVRALLTALGSLYIAVGCGRGAQGSEGQVPNGGIPRGEAPDTAVGVRPGLYPQTMLGDIRNPYAGDPGAIATGRQLFVGMNCSGCHSAYAGGGMGPNLRDSLWIYGKSDAQLFSTIAEGRAYGMPAWGGKLPDDMIWRIVAYIHTLGTDAEPEKPPVTSPDKVRKAPMPPRSGG